MAINIPIITEFVDTGLKSAQGAFENFRKEVKNAEGAMGKFKAGAGAAFDTIKANAGAFALAGGAALAAFGAKAISAASDYEESTAKIGEIFGDAADSVNNFAEDAARALGQSKQSVLDAAGIFGTFGKAAGLAGEDLATFSNDFTALASDLSSFNNTSPEEAITAIGAALRGESEPLRKYGILLDDASMRQKALELGIISTTKNALTPQQKILAAQALIFEQSKDAQGDFERTSGSLANQQKILAAQLENVTIEIGQKLLPVAIKFAEFANDVLVPIVLKVADGFGWFADAVTQSVEAADKVPKPLENAAKQATFWTQVSGKLLDVLGLVDDQNEDLAESTHRVRSQFELAYIGMQKTRFEGLKTANAIKELEITIISVDEALSKLKGNIDERQAWRNLVDEIDKTKEAAIDAWLKATPEALRASESALDRTRLKVAEYIAEVDNIPDSKKTEFIAALDQANVDQIENILTYLARRREIEFMPVLLPGVGGINEIGSGGRPIGEAPLSMSLSGPRAQGVTVNVAGSVVTELDLVESIRKGLVNSQRSGKQLVYSNT